MMVWIWERGCQLRLANLDGALGILDWETNQWEIETMKLNFEEKSRQGPLF